VREGDEGKEVYRHRNCTVLVDLWIVLMGSSTNLPEIVFGLWYKEIRTWAAQIEVRSQKYNVVAGPNKGWLGNEFKGVSFDPGRRYIWSHFFWLRTSCNLCSHTKLFTLNETITGI
jgi:hypothetical protein